MILKNSTNMVKIDKNNNSRLNGGSSSARGFSNSACQAQFVRLSDPTSAVCLRSLRTDSVLTLGVRRLT